MSLPTHFILIKGEPKSLQIEKIFQENNGSYCVAFKSTSNFYHYRQSDVVWLKDGVWYDPQHCLVFIGGRLQVNINNIYSYSYGLRTFWRIEYIGGYVKDSVDGSVSVEVSCLTNEAAKNVMNYLKRVAQSNELGRDEAHNGILASQYEFLDFVNSSSALAPYLNASIHEVQKNNNEELIFPFGCNSSQEKAVAAAFSNQISVIQGPPGTGKTQTILNIIANILIQGKNVLVVSNNNAATSNVQEKLEKYGLGFIVASLGSNENKDEFIKNQPELSSELPAWKLGDKSSVKHTVVSVLAELKTIFAQQEELAKLTAEQTAVELEWQHFMQDNQITADTYCLKQGVDSQKLLNLWLQFQAYAEKDVLAPQGFFASIVGFFKWKWLNFVRMYRFGIKSKFDNRDLQSLILEIQALYYLSKINELNNRISEIRSILKSVDVDTKRETLVSQSMALLKDSLNQLYSTGERTFYTDRRELSRDLSELRTQYPVVLSTTFSARYCTPKDQLYDYIIMDEASQVAVETGALALSCAKNAVIVGDTKQLPNVVTETDKQILNAIFNEFKLNKGYNSANYSFLESIGLILPNVNQTLLREHYRCHPKIINFCNQKFYGGQLLIMTEDKNEENVLMAVKTTPGNHARGQYNQREIDVVQQEVLPCISNREDVGIITPYREQVKNFNSQIGDVEAATVHKYQGREKNSIVMSVVDNQITDFADNANLLNVAISRAKNQFIIVLSGNQQERKGNISDLIDYIEYNNCEVSCSKINSVFDYLYSCYTSLRMSSLKDKEKISDFDSENLMFGLLTDILANNQAYSHLEVICHIPVRNVIHDFSLMNEEEKRYVSHYSTHLDFLIVNRVSKKPVLAIETDGYSYHNEQTIQHHRDEMKDHILKLYALPLLRLSTVGSGEKEKVMESLNAALC